MEEPSFKFDIKEAKIDLIKSYKECSERGLVHCAQWAAELNHSLDTTDLEPHEYLEASSSLGGESDTYFLAKSYLDTKEYDRCSHLTRNSDSAKCRFLHLYSKFLSIEKKKIDNMTDVNRPSDGAKNEKLKELLLVLKVDHVAKRLDGYCLYLFGVVLKKLGLNSLAKEVLIEAANVVPLLWGAWLELAPLVTDEDMIKNLPLPDHWMKQFFYGKAYQERFNVDEALLVYTHLSDLGFEKSSYVKAQLAMSYYNKRELDSAIELFKVLQEEDPYRIENLDTYSNLLYVRELVTDLANLAHHVVSVDKYKVETCCVIGNYYSLRSDHQKAVVYFQRALRLNPEYLSAWTLMGHEYMEMKNTNAAIQSYRRAIEISKRDYRAWYGLGQTYEIVRMPYYALYYYKQAQKLKPNDSRMLIGLGEVYEKLDKNINALHCYFKAYNVGDIEGIALIRLAKMYDKVGDVHNAASAYKEFCSSNKSTFFKDMSEICAVYKYLANYYIKIDDLDSAYTYAYKCLEFEESKEEGKALLQTIASKRSEHDADIDMDVSAADPPPENNENEST